MRGIAQMNNVVGQVVRVMRETPVNSQIGTTARRNFTVLVPQRVNINNQLIQSQTITLFATAWDQASSKLNDARNGAWVTIPTAYLEPYWYASSPGFADGSWQERNGFRTTVLENDPLSVLDSEQWTKFNHLVASCQLSCRELQIIDPPNTTNPLELKINLSGYLKEIGERVNHQRTVTLAIPQNYFTTGNADAIEKQPLHIELMLSGKAANQLSGMKPGDWIEVESGTIKPHSYVFTPGVKIENGEQKWVNKNGFKHIVPDVDQPNGKVRPFDRVESKQWKHYNHLVNGIKVVSQEIRTSTADDDELNLINGNIEYDTSEYSVFGTPSTSQGNSPIAAPQAPMPTNNVPTAEQISEVTQGDPVAQQTENANDIDVPF